MTRAGRFPPPAPFHWSGAARRVSLEYNLPEVVLSDTLARLRTALAMVHRAGRLTDGRFDARVLAMHVIQPVVFIVPPTIFSKPDYDAQAPRAKAAESIESWCAPLREGTVEHETRIADGVVADMIMKVAITATSPSSSSP